jgi:DNA-binding MarR family transcriptional regulator
MAVMTQPHTEYECAQAWAALSSAHALVSEKLTAELTRACGVSVNEFEVLVRLHRVPSKGLRLNECRENLRLSQPATSRMMARLEERGLIARDADPGDGRGVLITITAHGAELLDKAVPAHASVIRERLLDRLSPADGDTLARILDRIVR